MEVKLTPRLIEVPLKCLFISALAFFSVEAAELPPKTLEGLGSKQFREREAAQEELLTWARTQSSPAMDELLRQSRIADDPEVRERCNSVLRTLVTDEYLNEGEGYIGIGLKDEISDVPGEPKPRGVIRVTEVKPGSPAERAGIRPNDLIVGINGEVWPYILFQANVRLMKPNMQVDLKVLRDGGLVDLKVTLGRRPLGADAQLFDPEAMERAAKEAYFRRWLSLRKLPK
ncbi:MAG: PDZ domain-containing protein [Verrucomicrobiota bacterium]